MDSDDTKLGSSDSIFTITQRELVEHEAQYDVRAASRAHAYATLMSYTKNSREGATHNVVQLGTRVRSRKTLGQPTCMAVRMAVPPVEPITPTETIPAFGEPTNKTPAPPSLVGRWANKFGVTKRDILPDDESEAV